MRDWYRRSDMGKHTAVLAAVVAAASLAISAWGTWKSAQVADDQLAQSRDQQQKALTKQASLVTSWAESNAAVVANRSLDPASVFLRWNDMTHTSRRFCESATCLLALV